MIKVFGFATFLCLMIPATPCVGQGPDGPGADDPRTQVSKAMYEDIEIFRRILDGALLNTPSHMIGSTGVDLGISPHAGPGGALELLLTPYVERRISQNWAMTARNPWWHHAGIHGMTGAEGVYLKRYGVVYNVTLPWHSQKLISETARPEAKSRSQWDVVRGELRGEKTEQTKTPAERDEPAIGDVVVKLLAENINRFSQLRENEQITVAVTLRPIGSCASCHDANAANIQPLRQWLAAPRGGMTISPAPGVAGPTPADPRGNLSAWQGAQNVAAVAQSTDAESQRTDATNYIRLGEMRQKQGRLQEAIDAYRKAAEVYQKVLRLQPKPDDKDVSQAADLAAKLAQAYMLTGDQDQALKSLQLILRQPGPAGLAKAKGTDQSAGPESLLPVKLIISARKQPGAQGAISPEKLNATYELIQFPAPPKPAEKSKP